MNNYTTTRNNLQSNSTQSRRDLLESTKLSRLPERKPFTLDDVPFPQKATVVVAVCAGCGGRLETDNTFQNSIRGCGKCIGIYTRIDAAIEEASKRKIKETLEKMIGGVE
jgi:hypothetical protein